MAIEGKIVQAQWLGKISPQAHTVYGLALGRYVYHVNQCGPGPLPVHQQEPGRVDFCQVAAQLARTRVSQRGVVPAELDKYIDRETLRSTADGIDIDNTDGHIDLVGVTRAD